MRFTAYLGACAALAAATQAADIGSVSEVPVALDAAVDADANTELGAESAAYLTLDADAAAEAEAYLQAGLKSAAEAVAYAEALINFENIMMAEMQNEGSGESENLGQCTADAENWFTDWFTSKWEAINKWYDGMKDVVDSWGEDVKEAFGKMVEEGRNLRISSLSKMITRGIKGQTAFMELGHEYTDHCATLDDGIVPMNFEDFFRQTNFYEGEGDWPSYEALHKQMGEEPALDSYLTLRRDSRTKDLEAELKAMYDLVEAIVK